MEIEFFTLCDAVNIQAGKPSLLGIFEAIQAPCCPVVLGSCAVAARLRFVGSEEGARIIGIRIIDADGSLVTAAVLSELMVSVPPAVASVTHTVVHVLSPLVLAGHGDYQVDLLVNGAVIRSLPLQVLPMQAPVGSV